MTETLDLFPDLPHVEPVPVIPLSAGQRLTARQREAILAGRHPLSNLIPGLRLHADAVMSTDPAETKAGPTCGGCLHRRPGGFAKCVRTELTRSRSAASDCRAWWPACRFWEAS